MNKFSPLPILIFLMLSSFNAFAQEVKVKGKVMDGKREVALEFANIALLSPSDSALVTGARDLPKGMNFLILSLL